MKTRSLPGLLSAMAKNKRCSPAQSEYQRYALTLRTANFVVAGVHFTSFLVLLIFNLTGVVPSLLLPIWHDVDQAVTPIVDQAISVTLLPFPLITAIFHLVQGLGVACYFRYALVKGYTPHRWLEYAITNGLVGWSVHLLAGVGNIFILVTSVVLNAIMNYFGYLHEKKNAGCQRSLSLLWFGFVPYLPLWYAPLSYFFLSGAARPAFYGWAIIGSFLLSFSFVFPLFWRFSTRMPEMRANFTVEMIYLILSLTAKLYLDWAVTIGLLFQ